MWLVSWIVACRPAIPPASPPVGPPPEPADAALRLAWMLGSDPLARRLRLPSTPVEEPGLAEVIRAARDETTLPEVWFGLEGRHPGTVVVPLARGARLAAQEYAGADPDAIVAALVPLDLPRGGAGGTRGMLDWSGVTDPLDLLRAGERQVLLGWLAHPAIPRAEVRALLREDDWARLAATPAGALLLRADDPGVDGSATADLAAATGYALARAAADTAGEQAAIGEERARLAAAYGVGGDPQAAMLRRAREGLTREGKVGLALVALAAERLGKSCPDLPCAGLDRVSGLRGASAWSADAARYAQVWTVLALKEARDHLDVAWDEPSFPSALDAVIEALVGLGLPGLDRSLLRQTGPGPGVNLALSRALGAGDQTSRASVLAALDERLAAETRAALATSRELAGVAPWTEPLERILRRSERAR